MARLSPFRSRLAAISWALAVVGAMPAAANEAYVAYVPDRAESSDPAGRDSAVAAAREQALAIVLQRLTATRDHPRLPVATGPNVAGYVEEVAVLADGGRLRVSLRPDAVRAMLDGFGLDYLDTPAPLLVVVPIFHDGGVPVLWSGTNPWLDAWLVYPAGAGLAPLAVPYGEFGDVEAVNAQEAIAGDGAALGRLSGRYEAAGTLVAEYRPAGGEAEIRLTVAAADGWQATTILTAPSDSSIRQETLDAVVEAVGRLWVESRLQPRYEGPLSTVELTASFASLDDWIAIRRALDEASIVERFDVPVVSGHSARLILQHYADLPSLQRDLAGAGLVIEPGLSANGLPGLTVRHAGQAVAADPRAAGPGSWDTPALNDWGSQAQPPPGPQGLTIAPHMPTLRFEP